MPAVRRNQTGGLRPSVFEVGRGGTRKTRGSQPERDNMAVGRWPSVNSDGTESEEAESTRNTVRR